MPDRPTERALRLLALLQARRVWSGTQLAGRMQTDARTLRRDIHRLRELGYRIDTRRGPGGGYSLSTGDDLPPLQFTPDEALAVAASLASTAASGAAGGNELSLTALAKVEQVMPKRTRGRVRALRSSMSLPQTPHAMHGVYAAPLDPDVLGMLALACRDSELVSLQYMETSGIDAGQTSARRVEPMALVPREAKWFLVGRDLDYGWTALRVDKITLVAPTGKRFKAWQVPHGDPTAFLAEQLGAPPRSHSATILIHAPIGQVQAYMSGYASDFNSATLPDGERATLFASPTHVWKYWQPGCYGCAGRLRSPTRRSSRPCSAKERTRSSPVPKPRHRVSHDLMVRTRPR